MNSVRRQSAGVSVRGLFETLERRQLLNGDTPFDTYHPALYTWAGAGAASIELSKTSPIGSAVALIRANAAQFGLTPADLTNFNVTYQYTDADTGTTHLYLRQTHDGLDIAGADLNFNLDRNGKLLNVNSSFVSAPTAPALSTAIPKLISATAALQFAATALGLGATGSVVAQASVAGAATLSAPSVSLDDVPAKLHFVPTAKGGLTLAWDLVIRTTDDEHWYDVSVDGTTGQVVRGNDWVDHASYTVFPRSTESPNHGSRVSLVNPQDATASPFGWHDTNGAAGAEFTDTRGNNVDAHTDLNDDDSVGSNETRTNGGASLVFNPSLDLSQDPANYQSAAVTNLFYSNNTSHDLHYKYGFTEAAGNFQVNNYGKGGTGNDAVQADAQDGGNFRDSDHIDNANFATPPEGTAPRMQMYLFDLTNPLRDGDLDAGVMYHEYGHGVSNRLTGGAANSNALDATQSGGMGEGWSDFWGLMFTQLSTDTINQAYPIGTYVLGQANNGAGIRREPYSFNMAVNDQTFALYNSSNEVHDTGELWCGALWDMNWNLIQKYGFTSSIEGGYDSSNPKGNTLTLKLVMDALKLQPANPRFTDARDAILLADRNLTGGANQTEIWQAFARRGLGFSANAGSTADATTITPAFDVPATSSIAGTVFNDTNGNATQDSGEPGLSGVRVYFDSNNNGVYDTGTASTTQTYNSPNVPVTINDLSTITSTLGVAGRSGVVTDVNVKININHTADSDLIVTLISPDGTRIALANRVGSLGDNFTNTVFDDAAATAIADGTAPFAGTFRPSGALSGINGETPNGTWTLEVQDAAEVDTGTLNSWSITLSAGVPAEVSTFSAGNGAYAFSSLSAGTYRVRQVVPSSYSQTLPAGNGGYLLTLGGNDTINGRDFGDSQGTAPEVEVRFGTVTILDNDTSPSASEGTDFGTVTQLGASVTRTYTVRNTGTTPLNTSGLGVFDSTGTGASLAFSIVEGLSSTIAPGASDTFTVALSTNSDGPFTDQVRFSNNDSNENPYNFLVSAVVNPAPKRPEVDVRFGSSVRIYDGDLSPGSADGTYFGTVPVGSTGPTRTFTVFNAGDATLSTSGLGIFIYSTTSTSTAFSVVEGLSASIAPLSSDTFTIRFNPTSAGQFTRELRFNTNDSDEGVYNFAIRGTAGTSATSINLSFGAITIADNDTTPSSGDGTDFGTVAQGSSGVVRSFVLRNVGSSTLNLSGLGIFSPGTNSGTTVYSILTGLPASLAAGASATLTIRLNTNSAGTFTREVRFNSNDAISPLFNFYIRGVVV